jgi:hypothetical protein
VLTFQHRIKQLKAEELVVDLPKDLPPRDPTAPTGPQKTQIGLIIADGAILQTRPDVRFQFERLQVHNAGPQQTITFETNVHLPNPRSRLTATGKFGPWNKVEAATTPVSCSYELVGGDLSQYNSIAGVIESRGTVTGTISRMQVNGEVKVADFEVNHNGHRIPVQGTYSAVVNGRNGDTLLPSVNVRFLQTSLDAHGGVTGSPGTKGKTVMLDFESEKAQIQDLLVLTTKAQPPTLSGPISLRAHVVMPPEHGRFLEKIRLSGGFRISGAKFNQPVTQNKVQELSARSRRDETPSRVLSQLSAMVELRKGVADIRDARFSVPGATALGGGTYNLITRAIDLKGTLAMESTVSEASSGFKSFLLKPFDGIFRNRRRQAGAELPIHISGSYPKPKFQVNLVGKKRRR